MSEGEVSEDSSEDGSNGGEDEDEELQTSINQKSRGPDSELSVIKFNSYSLKSLSHDTWPRSRTSGELAAPNSELS